MVCSLFSKVNAMAKLCLVLAVITVFISFATALPVSNATAVCAELANKISNKSAILYQCESLDDILF